MLNVRVKRAVLNPRESLPDERHAKLQAMVAAPVGGVAQPALEEHRGDHGQDDEPDAVRLEEGAGADQDAGDERQLRLARLEDRDDLRHHEDEQGRDDDEAHHCEHDRIQHRRQDLLADLLAAFGIDGEALEHVIQMPGLFAGRDRGAIDLRKDPRELREPIGERMSFHHLRAHAEDDALHARLLGLLRDGEQRFLERQAGAHQGGQLAREEREIGRSDAADEAERLLAVRFLLRHLVDGDRQELALAQELADVPRGVAFQDALAFLAGVVERYVFEGPHGAVFFNPRG